MKSLMVQGTTSDAGKTTLVAGLCRVLSRRHAKVAPFKPQNMALNSAVTADGGEIGRAQALQAMAAGVELSTDFNPILLKPNTDTGAQVIVQGRAISSMEAATFHDYKKVAMEAVIDSYQRLATRFDYCLIEGAGSPAEINLRENDIANMGFACKVNCPVILIADIDKGGVFAHLVGTLALLSEQEQHLVKGFVINRFRGDIALLQSGLDWLENYTQKPVLGVLPYLHGLSLDAEDAIDADNPLAEQVQVRVAVLLLPHLSNHTDFDALRLNPAVDLRYLRQGQSLGAVDLVIIPGSKNVLGDLAFLRAQSWDTQLHRHLRYGGKVLGICGGLQMLGERIDDPDQLESSVGSAAGLGLAAFATRLFPDKTLCRVQGQMNINGQHSAVSGYEIHCGESQGPAFDRPLLRLERDEGVVQTDGFISDDQQVIGTYLHGLFDTPEAAELILNWCVDGAFSERGFSVDQHREAQLNRLADCLEANLELDRVLALCESQC